MKPLLEKKKATYKLDDNLLLRNWCVPQNKDCDFYIYPIVKIIP